MRISSLSRQFGRSCGLSAACASMMLAPFCLAQDGGDATPATPPVTTTPATPDAVATKAPEVKDVIAHYIKALGGETAIRSQTSRKMTGVMSSPGRDAIPVVIYSSAPNRMLIEFEVKDMGTVRQGFDGKTAWSLDPDNGPLIMDQSQVAVAADQADFYADLNFDKRFKSMESKGESEFDGVKCYLLKMVDQFDEESDYYFEVESGLLRATTMMVEGMMGPMEMARVNTEFKEFGGVMFPVNTEIRAGGMANVMKYTDIEIDTVKDEIFALPDEVKALVKAAEEAAAAPEPVADPPIEPAKPEPKKDKI